jgi:AraC-like DNA-binding protein
LTPNAISDFDSWASHFASEANRAVRKSRSKSFSRIPSTSGVLVRLVSARIAEAGIELKPLLAKCGLTVQQVKDRATRFEADNESKFVNLAAQVLGDDFLGFNLARTFDLREIGLTYFVLASAETLGEAFPRVARYSRIVNEGIVIRYAAGKQTTLTLDYVGITRRLYQHEVEAWITALIRTFQQLTGTSLAPSTVKFIHYRDKLPSDLNRLLGAHVSFGADSDEFSFPAAVKNMPIVSADPYLDKILITYSEEVLSRRGTPSSTFCSNVENAIAVLLPHSKPKMSDIARKLGITRRTMARRLSSEGLTYSGVLSDLRYELAKHYLGEQGLSISRIAWLLGYHEVSAFTHAFKRKSGRTPNQFRRNPTPARRGR